MIRKVSSGPVEYVAPPPTTEKAAQTEAPKALKTPELLAQRLTEKTLGLTQAKKVDEAEKAPEPKTLREAFDSVASTGGGRAITRLLTDNVEAWTARWDMMKGATKTIDSTYFILERDAYGFAYLGLHLKKMKEGVKVRMMTDAMADTFGQRGFKAHWGGRDYLQELANYGADVGVYHPIHWRAGKLASLEVAASNHDKILVIDGEQSMTGGRNIACDYFQDPDDHASAWRDTDVIMDGKGPADGLTVAFEREFKRDTVVHKVKPERFNWVSRELELTGAYLLMDEWIHAPALNAEEKAAMRENPTLRQVWAEELVDKVTGKLPAEGIMRKPSKKERKILLKWAEELAGNPALRGSASKPKSPERVGEVKIIDQTSMAGGRINDMAASFVSLCKNATKEIKLENPYVVLTEEMLQALEEASGRGVQILCGTNSPKSTDSAVTQAFFLDEWAYILARVPTAKFFVATGDRKLHAKVATIDEQVSIVSTYNMDLLSGVVNSEVAAVIWDDKFAGDVNGSFDKDLNDPKNGVLQWDIERDAYGKAILKDGKPVVKFGPEDHLPKELLKEYAPKVRNWRLIRKLPYFKHLDHPALKR